MQLFYSNNILDDIIILSDVEKKHCINVLRYKINDLVHVVDGNGNLYECKLIESSQSNCKLKINNIYNNFNKRNYYVHIAISPIKSHDRLEFFIEKSVEIGVDEISFIRCERTLRKSLRRSRIKNTAIVAMKQTIQAKLPKINPIIDLDEFINKSCDENRFICHLQDNESKTIVDYKNNFKKNTKTCILIGPEGDFTKNEVKKSIQNQYKPITLGANRLRTETAGIVACQLINFFNSL